MSRPRDPTTTMSAPSSSVIWMMAGPGCRLAEPANLNRICRQDRNVASVLRIRNDQWESTLGHRQLTPQCLAWCWRYVSFPQVFWSHGGFRRTQDGGTVQLKVFCAAWSWEFLANLNGRGRNWRVLKSNKCPPAVTLFVTQVESYTEILNHHNLPIIIFKSWRNWTMFLRQFDGAEESESC